MHFSTLSSPHCLHVWRLILVKTCTACTYAEVMGQNYFLFKTGSLCQLLPHWPKKKLKNVKKKMHTVPGCRLWPGYATGPPMLPNHCMVTYFRMCMTYIFISCRLHQYLSSRFPKYGTLYYTNICQLLHSSPSLFACSRSWNQHQHMWLEQLAWVWQGKLHKGGRVRVIVSHSKNSK